MTKVCLVNYFMWPVLSGSQVAQVNTGGEEVQHSLLAKALHQQGVEVSVVTGDFGQDDGATAHGVRVFKTYQMSAGMPGVRLLYPRLVKLMLGVRRANADVYYVSCAGPIVGSAHTRTLAERFDFLRAP